MTNIKHKRIHGEIRVYLGNRRVGTIRADKRIDGKVGVRYFPKDDDISGEWFPMMGDCKRSLEAENDRLNSQP